MLRMAEPIWGDKDTLLHSLSNINKKYNKNQNMQP
jgi:hypothetical protein